MFGRGAAPIPIRRAPIIKGLNNGAHVWAWRCPRAEGSRNLKPPELLDYWALGKLNGTIAFLKSSFSNYLGCTPFKNHFRAA